MVSPDQQLIDRQFMMKALVLAELAGQEGEVPVGALVVLNGVTQGEGRNCCVANCDPSGHAEIVALKNAAAKQGFYRLDGSTLYVTLEPCLMCCGALLQSRVSRLVFGAREPRTGAIVSIHESLRVAGVEPHVAISEGVMAEESSNLMGRFFKSLR